MIHSTYSTISLNEYSPDFFLNGKIYDRLCAPGNQWRIAREFKNVANTHSRYRQLAFAFRTFFKTFQLKNYWTDFDKRFFNRNLNFFLTILWRVFVKIPSVRFFTTIQNLCRNFTMLWKFFTDGISTKTLHIFIGKKF